MTHFSGHELSSRDLFALRYVHDARLSPDGRRVAYVVSRTVEETDEELFAIALQDLTTGATEDLAYAGAATDPRWSPDGLRLAFVGASRDATRVYVYDQTSRHCTPLTPEDCEVSGAPAWSPDGGKIVYTVISRAQPPALRRVTKRIFRAEDIGAIEDLESALYCLDVSSGRSHRLQVGCKVAKRPAFSPCGKRILFFGSDGAVADEALVGGLKLFTVDVADENRVEVLGEGWFIAAAAWLPDGERVVIAGAHASTLIVPKADVWVINRDGSNPQCRTPGMIGNVGFRIHHDMPTWGTSQDAMLCVVEDNCAYATVLKGGCTEIWRITLAGEPSCEPVVTGLRSCLIMDVNDLSKQLVYCVSDLNTPWELHRSNLLDGEETSITRLNAVAMAGWPPLHVEHLKFTSNDAQPLEGWCCMRADSRGPRPTVLFIHGGPMLAVGHAFRFDFHLLAAAGFAVLFSNFRGSSGYGEAFMQALVGDWGARGYPDHIAAVEAAIARGLSDANRLGVWGPSHGGFASCWIVTHTTRFRAAVAESAVTNFATGYYLSDAPDIFSKDLGGTPDEIPDVYRSRSPLTYARFCRTPTLMLHGEDDLRCPIAEAEQFYRALHDSGCTTELVRVPGMTHMGDSVGPLSARRAQNEALLEWFKRWL